MSPPDEMIREKDLHRFTGYSRSHTWKLIKQGKFPAPVRIGPRRKVWLSSAIRAWQDQFRGEGK